MSLKPRSPEFARLATRWLDGVATRDEAARLWEAVLASKECAAEFAVHARFESLLEHTCRERAREAVVTGAVHKEGRRQQRRSWLKMAAAIAVVAMVLRLVWPDTQAPAIAQQAAKPPAPAAAPAPKAKRSLALQPTRLLIAPAVSEPAGQPVIKSLMDRLDEFFLTSVTLDHVPLREALRRLEEQLRAVNFTRMPDLERLRATLPAEAAGREVTFHSGAISYLKAVRAIAALANCDVTVSDTGVALTTQMDTQRMLVQSRSIESLLAGDGKGLHFELAELLEDARGLGLVTEGDAFSPGTIRGTQAQFLALAQLADSRRQIRSMPSIGLLPFIFPGHVDENGRALTESEVTEQLRLATHDGDIEPELLMIKPSSSPGLRKVGAKPPILTAHAMPVGSILMVTVEHSTDRDLAPTDFMVQDNTGVAFRLGFSGPVSLGSDVTSTPSDAATASFSTANGGTLVLTGTASSASNLGIIVLSGQGALTNHINNPPP